MVSIPQSPTRPLFFDQVLQAKIFSVALCDSSVKGALSLSLSLSLSRSLSLSLSVSLSLSLSVSLSLCLSLSLSFSFDWLLFPKTLDPKAATKPV